MPARPFEHEADRVVHLQRAFARVALEGKVGDDQRLRGARAAVLDGAAGGGADRRDAGARGAAAGAGREDQGEQKQRCAAEDREAN